MHGIRIAFASGKFFIIDMFLTCTAYGYLDIPLHEHRKHLIISSISFKLSLLTYLLENTRYTDNQKV